MTEQTRSGRFRSQELYMLLREAADSRQNTRALLLALAETIRLVAEGMPVVPEGKDDIDLTKWLAD